MNIFFLFKLGMHLFSYKIMFAALNHHQEIMMKIRKRALHTLGK